MMRRNVLAVKMVPAAFFLGAALFLWPGTSQAAAPKLGGDCGAGATIVGSDQAGKVTVGTDTSSGGYYRTCTLTFSVPWPKAPACQGMNESGRYPAPVGVKSTTATVVLDGTGTSIDQGDVISYICIGY